MEARVRINVVVIRRAQVKLIDWSQARFYIYIYVYIEYGSMYDKAKISL